MRKVFRTYGLLFLIASAIIILDQVTKALVRQYVPFEGIWSPFPWLTPYARIVHWSNTGAAFGIFQRFGGVFSVLAIVVSVVIIAAFPKIPSDEKLVRVALGLQLGGALGNLIDRLTIGHVTDFISVGSFAVFNVADSAITIGVVVLLWAVWLKERQEKAAAALRLPQAANGNSGAEPLAGVEGDPRD